MESTNFVTSVLKKVVFVQVHKKKTLISLNPAAVISASKDVYESLSPIYTAPPIEDTWINYSIQGLDDPNRPFPYHKYQTWNALIDFNQEVTSKTKKYLSNIQKEDLLKPVFRVNNDGVRRTSLFPKNCIIELK